MSGCAIGLPITGSMSWPMIWWSAPFLGLPHMDLSFPCASRRRRTWLELLPAAALIAGADRFGGSPTRGGIRRGHAGGWGCSRTVVNDTAGAPYATRRDFTAILVSLAALYLTPLFGYMPRRFRHHCGGRAEPGGCGRPAQGVAP